MSPVVNHVVSEIHLFLFGLIAVTAPAEARIPAIVTHKKIMMKTGILTSPDTSIAMFTFGVNRFFHTFGNQTPLQGEVFIVVKRSAFIHTPAHTAMINYDLFISDSRKGIVNLSGFISKPETKITNYNIIGTY